MNKIISKLHLAFAIIVMILFFVSKDTSVSILNWVAERRAAIIERRLERALNRYQRIMRADPRLDLPTNVMRC